MIDSGENTIAKRFYTDSIKNAKRLTPSALKTPIRLSRCHSGAGQTKRTSRNTYYIPLGHHMTQLLILPG